MKKPEKFEAFQFMSNLTAPEGVEIDSDGKAFVTTAHYQRVYLEVGDWVRKEQNGDGYYPIKDSIMSTIADHLEE
jgi:hypothetical protein